MVNYTHILIERRCTVMKRNLQRPSLSRRAAVRSLSVCDFVKNAAQELFALRFYFFVFAFTHCSICGNCT